MRDPGSAAPECGATYPQRATPRSLARLRRTGVRSSQCPMRPSRLRSPHCGSDGTSAPRYDAAGMMIKARDTEPGQGLEDVLRETDLVGQEGVGVYEGALVKSAEAPAGLEISELSDMPCGLFVEVAKDHFVGRMLL